MKKLARRHQQQQEQQNSQRLGQGRGFVKKQSERETICSCLKVPFPRDTSAQQFRAHAGLWERKQSPSVHQQWKGLSAHTRLLQILLVGSDPRGACAEAVTSFLVEICHVEVFALEEISRRLTPERSSSLFSSAVGGHSAQLESAQTSALLPQPRHGEPPHAPTRVWPPRQAQLRGTGTCCAALWVLLSISSSQDLAASNPPLYPEQKLENNF